MNTDTTLRVRTSAFPKTAISDRPVDMIGFWAAVSSLVFGLGYVAAQLFSWLKIITYPNDLFWLFLPSLFLAPAFLITMICLHYRASYQLKVYTAIGVAFALVYCTMATLTYFTQLGAIVPLLVRGDIDQTHPLFFKSRSFTMAIDCLGYFFMSMSTLFAAFAFKNTHRKLYWWLLGNGALVVLLIPAFFYPVLYYIASIWAVSFSVSMVQAAKLMRGEKLFPNEII